jgi:AmiR/NasT family two-component response regulator
MAPVLLIHWNWSETIDLAASLRSHGWDVITESEDGVRAVQIALDLPLRAIVISLDLAPKHGRDVALALADTEEGATGPVVFFGGDEGAHRKVLKALPDALIVSREHLADTLSILSVEQAQ